MIESLEKLYDIIKEQSKRKYKGKKQLLKKWNSALKSQHPNVKQPIINRTENQWTSKEKCTPGNRNNKYYIF